MSKPWDGIISEEEQRAYRAAGFGRPTGIGSRPGLLIIDVQYRTVGTNPLSASRNDRPLIPTKVSASVTGVSTTPKDRRPHGIPL